MNELVEVKIRLPKAVVDFLEKETSGMTMENYRVYNIVACVESDLDATDGPFFNVEQEIQKGLKEVFKKHDC